MEIATFPVFALLVEHPDGPVLIDTGVGLGHDVMDELYSPVHQDLDEALAEHGVEVSEVTTVITSHPSTSTTAARTTGSLTLECWYNEPKSRRRVSRSTQFLSGRFRKAAH